MPTWIVKSQTDTLSGARAILRENQIQGHEAWIEDEDGRRVDELSIDSEGLLFKYSRRKIWLAILYWTMALLLLLVFLAALYVLGLWVDHDL